VGDVPERDSGLGEKVGDRHEGGADDAERMFDAVHLKDFNECFFRGHFHYISPFLALFGLNVTYSPNIRARS
jgi:hypothetical protein